MAMTKEQLKERANKCLAKIQKLEKKVEKYSKLVSNEFKAIIEEAVSIQKFERLREYNLRKYNDRYCHGDEYDYYHAKSDLEAAKNTHSNYLAKIAQIEEYESEEKIRVIWDFLNNWEEKAFNWYMENAKLYIELRKNYDQAWEEVKEKYSYEANYISYNGEPITRTKYNENRFRENYYFNIQSLTKQIVNYKDVIDTDKLFKALEDEKDRKYKDLIKRVTKVVGLIKDASNLSIGNQQGEINGIITGEKGRCWVETISAGGYNIQCFHYRVLVKELK